MKKQNIRLTIFILLVVLLIPSISFATGTGVSYDNTALQHARNMFLDAEGYVRKFVQFSGVMLTLFGLATVGISLSSSGGDGTMTTQGLMMLGIGAVIFSVSFFDTTSTNFVTNILSVVRVAFVCGGGLLTMYGASNFLLQLQTSQPVGVKNSIVQIAGGILIVVTGMLFSNINVDITSSSPITT